jgi:hypothetical protein
LRRRQHAYARSGELDREREAIEQAHDFGHRVTIAVVDGEVRSLRAGARSEEVDRILVQRQRLERIHVFARQLQPLAARHDEGCVGSGVEPPTDRPGGVLDDLLEIVYGNKTAATAGDRVAEMHTGITRAEMDAECTCDGEIDSIE